MIVQLNREIVQAKGARVSLGREKRGRQLADPAFIMADQTMAEITENLQYESRHFNDVYADGKLPCPHRSCRSEAGKAFFQNPSQHF